METIFLSDEQPLGSSDLKRLRRHAAKVLEMLEQTIRDDCEEKSLPPPSWVGGGGKGSGAMDESNPEVSFRKRYFDTHGFWVARGFCDVEEVSSMKDAMGASVRDNWFPQGTSNDENQQEEKVTSFGTGEAQNKARGDPFLESADKVSYFAEPTALDPESGSLKPEFRDTDKKMLALCKAGHGLHLPPLFRNVADESEKPDEKKSDSEDDTNQNVHGPFFDYTSSSKLRDLVLSLGWKDPVVPQSMYIFKNPKVGGAVHSHQDSTFLYTTPRQTCLGLWLALDDATLKNGALWVRAGSHREPVRRQFLRNPKHQSDASEPKLTFKVHDENPEVQWEGATPKSVEVVAGEETGGDDRDFEISSLNFVPVEVKAGDLLVFCGTLDHFSLPNFSEEQRHTFQLHLVEGPNAGVEWSPSNWLQYEDEEAKHNDFLRLLDYANGDGR